MNVHDMVVAICKHAQKQVLKDLQREEKDIESLQDYFNVLFTSLSTTTQIKAQPDNVHIEYIQDTVINEDLQKPIKQGYWVVVFYFSADFYDIQRFDDVDPATHFYYEVGEQENFVGTKFILLVTEDKITEIC